ncbi:hypothetical protein F5876DRAFT_69321 [Lentinula aff. lateritia]|uniref:Uncharacterized protein n=1 Tax=Lentinula aff. lateritia TaxID=2804960 RepID=A0ACC1TMP0_9AGAR|nr:hypothetical protein F5876DRAFT_69321 [Lentinula aff. lateritia]
MKHATRLLLSILAVVDLAVGNVISVSSKAHGKPTAAVQVNSWSGTTIGSVYCEYWMTNEDSGNYILAADVGSDGQVNLREAYATGGMGLHGINGGNTGPDGLFGQGSVAVSNVTNKLVAVNPGSGTVSLFSINPSDPSNLTLIGDPAGSGGQWPTSVTFNKAGDIVCALNGGEVNGVSCFSVNQTSGLTPLADTTRYLGINQTTPAAGPTNTVSQILFSSDSSKLLVAYSGTTPTAPGYLGYYDIGVNGSLSKNFSAIAPPSGGVLPFSITPVPGQEAYVVADPALGFEVYDLTGANRSSAVAISGQGATCWSTYSPSTGSYLLIDAQGRIFEIAIDAATLQSTIIGNYTQFLGDGLIDSDVMSVNGTDYMFTLAAGINSLEVFALPAPGRLQSVQQFNISTAVESVGITVSSSMQGMVAYAKQ